MSIKTTSYFANPAFVADPNSMRRDHGHQVDWAYLTDAYGRGGETVKLGAAALKGATSLTVDALPKVLPLGTLLDFGTRAAVTVTVNDADVNALETSITVLALSGPIPAGTALQFSGSGQGIAVLSARAAAGATTLTVEPLAEDIDNAATAAYPGGRMLARVAAQAEEAAVAVTVQALAVEIPDDAEAKFGVIPGSRNIPGGTVFCELSSGLLIPRSLRPGSETAKYISIAPIAEDDKTRAASGWGFFNGGVVAENMLPEASGDPKEISGTYKTELTANGCTFFFIQTGDSRAD